MTGPTLPPDWKDPSEAIFAELPDGSLVDGYMAVVSYTDPDGERRWFLAHELDLPVSWCVGLLELAKLQVIHRTPGAVDPHIDPDDG